MDASEIKAAAGETGGILKAGQGQDNGGSSSAKEPAQLNVKAASKYLGLLSRDRAHVSDGLQRALNSVHSTLNSYLQDPQRIRNAAQASSMEGEGEFSRLSSRVISRDASLSESVAEDLSTKSHLVRSRDASAEFEKTMGDLPPALKEDTAAGAALSKAIAQSLLNLTDHQTLGAGLERDLAVRGVYVPEQELSQRSRDATSRVLQVSLAFAKSNSPEELKEIPAEPEPVKEAPGSTTPQIMTRYLRQALDEFPDDSTYLDIFRKNKEAGAPQPDDKVSIETAERIHNLIAKAAETARRGNLIPGGSQGSAAAEPNSGSSTASASNGAPRSGTAAAPDGGDARELSLSELSERASRLQRQFRLERQKLANEGQMPDPAEYPPSKTSTAGKPGTADAATAEASKADAAKIAEPVSAKQAPGNTTAQAAPENKEAAGASDKSAQAAPVEATAKAGQATAPSTLSLEDASVSVSYKAVQNPFYGGISSVPGMTLPVNGFDDQAALGFAARSMVQDFSTPRTISRILKEQEALAGGAQPAPERTAESSAKESKPQAAAASITQENAQSVQKEGLEAPAGNSAKATAAAGGNAAASSVSEEAPSTVSENGASKQASAAPASTAAATDDAVSDEALATEEAKPSSTVQTAKLQSQSVESSSPEETAPEAEAKPSAQAEADELEPAATEDAVDHASAEDATSSELKAASTAPAASGTQSEDEAAIEDDKSSKAQQEGAQAQASSSQAAAPAEDEAAGAIEEVHQEAQKAAQSSKPQAAFVAASQPAEASNEAPAAEAEDLESKQAAEPPKQEPSKAVSETSAASDANAATAAAKQTSVKSTDGQAADAGTQPRAADAVANDAKTTAEQDSKAANSAQSSKPQAVFTASASSAEAAAKAASEAPKTVRQPAQAGAASASAAPEAEASVPSSEEAPAASSSVADAGSGVADEDTSTAVQNPAKGTASSNTASQQILASAVSDESSAEETAAEEQPASASGKNASAASVASGSEIAASSPSGSAAISSSAQAAVAQTENADESADASPSKSASAAGLKASEAAQAFVAAGMSSTTGEASSEDALSEEADADKAGADADAKSASSQGSSIGDSIMKGTVPASELDDSDTPEDAPDNDGRNLGREAAGAIDTAKEASGEAGAAKAPAGPLKAPAAAAVTTGGSAPVPQESVITTPQGTVKEGGFLRRLASIFSPSKAAANAAAAEAAAAQQGAALQLKLSQGSPLDVFASALASLGASRFLPPEARKEAKDLRAKLMDPVRDLSSVDSWLEFVAAPMSPSSPRAAAMHQWAFFILCLRFRELGKSVDKFLKKLGIDISADLPIDDMLLSHQDDEGAGEKLCKSTLSQIQRLQQLAPQDAEGFFNRAIPLPPAYDGGREGSLSLRREKKKDGRKIWHLQFAFDLEKLGPVEIRAVASFPEVRLSYVAQTLEGLQALQAKVPELERQLGDLGLEPRSSSPRIGRVDAMERHGEASHAAKAPDGMVDVDI